MKKLINTAIVLFVIIAVIQCTNQQSQQQSDLILQDLESKLDAKLKESEQTNTNDEVQVYQRESNESDITETSVSNTKTMVIRGLGDMDNSDLQYASQVVQDFFGYNCIVTDNLDIPNNIYQDNGNTIDARKAITEFSTNNVNTLFLTYKGLNENDMRLRGYTTLYGKSIFVRSNRSFLKETIIHEIGHTLGLDHCDDLTCIMAINNDAYDSGDFCNNCKSKINK